MAVAEISNGHVGPSMRGVLPVDSRPTPENNERRESPVLGAISRIYHNFMYGDSSPWDLGTPELGRRVTLENYNPDDPTTIPSATRYGSIGTDPRIAAIATEHARKTSAKKINATPLNAGISEATMSEKALDTHVIAFARRSVRVAKLVFQATNEIVTQLIPEAIVKTRDFLDSVGLGPDAWKTTGIRTFNHTEMRRLNMEIKRARNLESIHGSGDSYIYGKHLSDFSPTGPTQRQTWQQETLLREATQTPDKQPAPTASETSGWSAENKLVAYADVGVQPIRYEKPPLISKVGSDGVKRRSYGFFSPRPLGDSALPPATDASSPDLTGLDYFGEQRSLQTPHQPVERHAATLPISLPIQYETQATPIETVLNIFHGLSLRDTETPSLDAQGIIPLVPAANDPNQTSRWLYTNGSVIRMMARQQDGTMHIVSLTHRENNRMLTQVRSYTSEDRRNMGESLFNSVHAILSRNDTTPALVGPEEVSRQLLEELYTLCENNIAFYEMLDIPSQRLELLNQLMSTIKTLNPAIGRKTEHPAPRRTLAPITLLSAAAL